MNKSTALLILPAAILLSGCTSPIALSGSQPDNQAKETLKLAQIMERGGSAFCKVTDLSDNTTTEMTISGKKMKIVGMDMSEGKKGIMINDAVYVYSWEEGQNTGFKMKIPTEQEIKDMADEVQPTPQNLSTNEQVTAYDDDTKYTLNCETKNVADSEFAPPSSVNFIDPSQMQNLSPQELQKLFPQGEEE